MKCYFIHRSKSSITLFSLILFISINVNAQGPFIGANVSPRGFAGIRAGWSYYSLLDFSLVFQPAGIKNNDGGYGSASIKIPLKYLVVGDYYESKLIGGLFVNYNAGVMFKPLTQSQIENKDSYYSKTSYAGSWSLGTEILYMKGGFAFSLPVELGYGRVLHNQEFQKQFDITTSAYSLKRSYFLTAGIRFYFSKNHCKEATRGMKIGYY